MCLAQQTSPASYGSVYNIFTKYPLPNLISTVFEEYHLELQLVLLLVLFSLILIFCLKKKNIFCFSVSFWFFILSLIFKVYCPWFLKWRFWFSKWDKYGSYPRDSFSSRAFSHDVTAAILVFQNNETAAVLVYQENPPGVYLFSHVNDFFCSNKLA